MILYTPVSFQEIFEGADDQETSNMHEIDYQGVKIVVEPVSPSHGKIVRLISTDSNDYLNPNLQPGNFVNYASLSG